MFLIEKYAITDKSQLLFHKTIFENLEMMKQAENTCKEEDYFADMSHLIFYGHSGCGKTSLVNLFLAHVYDDTIYKTKKVKYTIQGYGNTNVDVDITQSNYHITIIPTNSGFDKYLIQNVINDYASRQMLNIFKTKRKFKTVIIRNVDNLSYYAQTSLRCTMEKYIHKCKFILCVDQMSTIIEPLKSRSLSIRVPMPTESDIFLTLFVTSLKENHFLSFDEINSIVHKSNRNIKNAMWLMEMHLLNIPMEQTWEKSIQKICQYIININDFTVNLVQLNHIKTALYNVLITNIELNHIYIEFAKTFVSLIPDKELYYQIVSICAEYEEKSKKGKRYIIHLEAMINKLLWVFYNKNKNDALKIQ